MMASIAAWRRSCFCCLIRWPGLEGTSSAIRFDMDVFGLSMVEHNPGVEATAYGLLADFLRAVQA